MERNTVPTNINVYVGRSELDRKVKEIRGRSKEALTDFLEDIVVSDDAFNTLVETLKQNRREICQILGIGN